MNTRTWLLLALLSVCAVPAFGQYQYLREVSEEDGGGGGWYGTTSYDNGQYMDNPCTDVQDWVWVTYSADVAGAQTEKNVDRYLFDEDTTMGGTYSASGTSFSDVGYASPVGLRKYHKVNTPDKFHVVTVIEFDPATKTTTVGVETACGDGSPDSLQ